jgi:hypothetical protein
VTGPGYAVGRGVVRVELAHDSGHHQDSGIPVVAAMSRLPRSASVIARRFPAQLYCRPETRPGGN